MPAEGSNIARLADARRRQKGGNGTAGGGRSSTATLVLDPKSPMETAEADLKAHHVDAEGRQLLRCQGGIFLRYDGSCYRPIEEKQLENEIYDFTRHAYRPAKDSAEPFNPDQRKVRDIVHALGALVHLSPEIPAPSWLSETPTDIAADDVLACRNTLVHLPTLSRLPHSPDFFTFASLDFDYEPEAACPRWLRFLDEVMPDDPDAIDQLNQMFGYLLTSDTRQQKTFLLIGPKRSGKGTTGRILQALVGERNVVSPGLSSLATTFGREQLLGKRVAMISDARLSGRTDQGPIIETILSISGEDPITVQRKFLPAWSGRLPLRFVMLSNELPDFKDIAGAFVSRWIILRFPNSFFGREDPHLTDALLAERPGILNWALAGLARLREAGRFAQPRASADILQRWEDLSSPIGAFLRTRCVIEPAATLPRDELFAAWKDWCEEQGMGRTGTKATFGKSLIANVVGLAEARGERDLAGHRSRLYRGIRIKTRDEMERQE